MSRMWTEHPARTGIRREIPLDFASPETGRTSSTDQKTSTTDAAGTDDGAARLRGSAAVWHYSAQAPAAEAVGVDESGASPGPARRLLLIHGFRGDHHGMALIVDALPEFEVFVPDLPGFGATAPLQSGRAGSDESGGPAGPTESGEYGEHDPAQHTLWTYAAFVEALAAALELGPGDVLVGHSFGSIIVAAHAARPERPRWAGLALFAPISNDIFTGSLLPGAAGVDLYYRASDWLPEGAAQALLRSPVAQAVTNASMIVTRRPEQVAYIRDQHRQHFSGFADRKTLLQAYWASSRHTVTEFAPRLDLPVLLVPGAKDQLSTPAGQRHLRRMIPQAHSEVLRDTGHLLHYEKPAQAARALRRFIASLG